MQRRLHKDLQSRAQQVKVSSKQADAPYAKATEQGTGKEARKAGGTEEGAGDDGNGARLGPYALQEVTEDKAERGQSCQSADLCDRNTCMIYIADIHPEVTLTKGSAMPMQTRMPQPPSGGSRR